MMLIATGLAAALLAAASFVPGGAESPADSTSSPAPPVVAIVFSQPGVPVTLVSRLLAETSAIWRASGVEFVWQHAAPDVVPYGPLAETPPYLPSALRVVIGDDRGVSRDDDKMPLGWIVFDDEHEPQREIYVSHVNALSLMETARHVVGVIGQMPPAQREVLLGRAMGRALAHELGHYLLASKIHTQRGLLKANRTAAELFRTASVGFRLDPSQRRQIAARMRGESVVASR
jgi:hypothetical protein